MNLVLSMILIGLHCGMCWEKVSQIDWLVKLYLTVQEILMNTFLFERLDPSMNYEGPYLVIFQIGSPTRFDFKKSVNWVVVNFVLKT